MGPPGFRRALPFRTIYDLLGASAELENRALVTGQARISDRGMYTTQYVFQQRHPVGLVVPTGSRRRVEGEAIERDAQWAFEHHRSSLEGQRASSPLRTGWRRCARDRRRREHGQAIALILGIAVHLVADGILETSRS
jgi:hypothetical protein